ncbi:MAG: hypothetical protein RR185_08080 [Angelakisella sp.]
MADTNYLNIKNPDVQLHLTGYKLRCGIPQWEPLTPAQRLSFELDFLDRLPIYQQERDYQYPFFLSISEPSVRAAYDRYQLLEHIGHGVPWTDKQRDKFERQFAAGKVAEQHENLF